MARLKRGHVIAFEFKYTRLFASRRLTSLSFHYLLRLLCFLFYAFEFPSVMTGECCLSRKPEVILLLSAAATRSPFAWCIGFFFFARGGRFGHGEQAAPDFGVAAATPRGG